MPEAAVMRLHHTTILQAQAHPANGWHRRNGYAVDQACSAVCGFVG